MRIIFSRKGFDSVAGGGASPIIAGRPVSLPIPDTKGLSRTTYGDLDLGGHAERASRGRLGHRDLCHHDPMFMPDNTAILGQCGAAQGHLSKQGVRAGDVFLFFGLFEGEDEPRHHRIFGYLKIAEIVPLAGASEEARARFLAVDHPHALGMHAGNDALYVGPGATAHHASPMLRLTAEEGPVGLWRRPQWLRRGEITYFSDKDANWPAPDRMYRVGNGQEFVADIGQRLAPRRWLGTILAEINRS